MNKAKRLVLLIAAPYETIRVLAAVIVDKVEVVIMLKELHISILIHKKNDDANIFCTFRSARAVGLAQVVSRSIMAITF